MNWQPFSPDQIQFPPPEESVWIFYGTSLPFDSPIFEKRFTAGEIEQLRKPTGTQRHRTKVLGRVARNHLLSLFLGLETHAITLLSGYHGKPYVKGSALGFSSSYSNAGYLVGITSSGSMGIDLESPENEMDKDLVATYFFSKKEFKNYQDDPDQFYSIWTKKEALFKALGTGIPELPSKVDANDLLEKMDLSSISFSSPLSEPATVVVPSRVSQVQFFTLDKPS